MALAAPTTSSAPGLTLAAATAGQQGNTATQQAAVDQAATQAAPPAQNPSFSSISSQNLQPTTSVNLPPPPPPSTTAANGLVAAGQQTSQSVQDYINSLTPTQPTAVDQAQQTLLNNISTLTGEDTGKDQALLNAQQADGATADQASLTALNNSLLTKTAQYNSEQANLGGNNSVETSAVLAAQNAGLTKARAADIGLTTAQIQAMQGNLTLAMNTAQQSVDAQYSTIEDNIKTQQSQLAALQPMLDSEQKTTAAAQQAYLAEQQQQVADQKATQTQINNVALQAASAGATPDELAAINNAPDVISAIAAAAPSLGAAAAQKLQQQAFTDNIQLQQLMISKAQLANSDAETNLKIQELTEQTSPASVLQYAQQYATSGVMPAGAPAGFNGAIAQVASSLPKPPGTIYDPTTGVAPTKLTPDQEQNVSALYNIVNNVLPQLSQSYTAPYGGTDNTNDQQTLQSYLDTANNLKTALIVLGNSGILKGTTSTFESLIPNDSFWTKGQLNTASGKQQIANLTNTLTSQLTAYLSSNGLSIAGFNDTTDQTGVNSDSSLSKFVTQ